ncbi:MAG TPA: maleylpyruvate isomerase family mycothiol-dependent enzyme [Acidimicrobiia bacterium]|nr:maleylpyruvate isomerase family mycothiol-dependent enzyme [Acidimicrobiia bacterium]HKN92029.1 maleylpyruvate isomerase family mycothiol-dependent enzyme [Acidimicrobiia bacterium]
MTTSGRKELGAELLLTERDALLPILRTLEPDQFDLETCCTGWAVRDVLAHCSAALTRVSSGTMHRFRPQDNEADVDERRTWPVEKILSELTGGYERAAQALVAAGGGFDGLALGEWVHGGDVRDAIGRDDAYASPGIDVALLLLADQAVARKVPLVEVTLPGQTMRLGVEGSGRPPGRLATDEATVVRLYAGRSADPTHFRLSGAVVGELVVFS